MFRALYALFVYNDIYRCKCICWMRVYKFFYYGKNKSIYEQEETRSLWFRGKQCPRKYLILSDWADQIDAQTTFIILTLLTVFILQARKNILIKEIKEITKFQINLFFIRAFIVSSGHAVHHLNLYIFRPQIRFVFLSFLIDFN